MQSIITVTFNPAIDKSTIVPALQPGHKMRCSEPVFEPGGGGINVARALQKLGVEATAFYMAGSYTGLFLQQLLQQKGIASVAVPIREHTRENLMVFDSAAQLQYRFVMPGPLVQEDEWHALIEKIQEYPAADYLVASGSLSSGIPATAFAMLARIAKKKGSRFIADTSGEPLRLALEEGVFLVKPNIREFCSLVGCPETDSNAILKYARKLVNSGKCIALLLSQGASGALLVTAEKALQIPAPMVKCNSTVGAGDSMLAGVIAALAKGKDMENAAYYGVACGSAAILNAGTQLCSKADADRLLATMARNPAGI